jgi:YD repeat-containing protein
VVGNRTGELGTDTNGASTVPPIYSYNARNELTGITDNLTPANSISYTYDANGNQTGKAQGTVQWTYGYDARDELTDITRTDNSGPVW